MDRIIEVKVSGNYLSKDNKVAGVKGEANVTNLHIAFDEGWDTFSKRITFWDALGNNPTKILLDNKRECVAPIPGEAMAEAGKLTFVIDGYNGGKKQRSVADELEVKDAPMAENAAEPVDPTPDQATQLQNYIDNHKNDKNNPHGVTASQAGALPIEGGRLKGGLTIKPGSKVANVSVTLDPYDGDTTAKIMKTGDTYGEHLDITDYGSADANSEAVTLRLCGEKASTDKSSGVVLINYANGYGTQYKLYGEHNKPTASDVGAYSTAETDEKLATVEAVAKGRSAGYVFDTEADMFEWLSEEENRSELVLGDNFYIRDTSVPDYWWDAKNQQACILETQKVDLTEYAKTSSVSEGLNKKANKNDVYTREETLSMLANKLNKSDISNVYKFKGSVENYDDLPAKMELIPKGTATVDGKVLDTVEDGVLKLKGVTLTNPREMRIPIEPILLMGGMWSDAVLKDADGGEYILNIGLMDTYGCLSHGYVFKGNVVEVDCVYVSLNVTGEITFDKDITSLGAVYRVPSQYETDKEGVLYDFSLDVGDVYNLRYDDSNVAWTGEDWDFLGGEHKDLEARDEIEHLRRELDNKAELEGVYKFKGFAKTKDDLPIKVSNPNGEPTRDYGHLTLGYNDEKNEVSISGTFNSKATTYAEIAYMPLTESKLSAGYYIVEVIAEGLNGLGDNISSTCSICDERGGQQYNVSSTNPTVKYIPVDCGFKLLKLTITGTNVIVDLDVKIKGVTFRKIDYSDELGMNPENYPSAIGDVYNVESDDANYAWNGVKWDTFGGEHKDLEARAMILEYANRVAPTPASVTIYADKWVQKADGSMWYQVVQVNNATITPYSKVDLQLSAEQVAIFYEKDLAFVTENEGGVVTVYCIGRLPENTYTIQATVSEVVVNGE